MTSSTHSINNKLPLITPIKACQLLQFCQRIIDKIDTECGPRKLANLQHWHANE